MTSTIRCFAILMTMLIGATSYAATIKRSNCNVLEDFRIDRHTFSGSVAILNEKGYTGVKNPKDANLVLKYNTVKIKTYFNESLVKQDVELTLHDCIGGCARPTAINEIAKVKLQLNTWETDSFGDIYAKQNEQTRKALKKLPRCEIE